MPPNRRSTHAPLTKERVRVFFRTTYAAVIALIGAAMFARGAEPHAPTAPTRPAADPPVTPIQTPATPPPAPSPAPPAMPAPLIETDFKPRLPRDTFEVQIALMRDACCPGSIDGALGSQTRAAIVAFQTKHDLAPTGQLDTATREALRLTVPPLKTYTVTENDLARLRPAAKTWIERSKLDCLGYTTVLELVSEKNCAHPAQIKKLNPGVVWEQVVAGTVLVVPNVFRSPPKTYPALAAISLSTKALELFDADRRLVAHFPCSIAKRVEKRPVGTLEVVVTAKDPNYTFNPEVFPELPEAQQIGRKLIIQPGPNNPVGVAWITLGGRDGLVISGYGIHGSPEPEQIGRTESHGCFRLSNWNAEYLLPLVWAGMPVRVDP